MLDDSDSLENGIWIVLRDVLPPHQNLSLFLFVGRTVIVFLVGLIHILTCILCIKMCFFDCQVTLKFTCVYNMGQFLDSLYSLP